MPSWLSRSPTLQSAKPVKVSEPKFARAIDLVASSATRLGLGATVVRTPDDALRDTGVRITYQSDKSLKHKLRTNPKRPAPLSPPTSPPLPPLPLPDAGEESQLEGETVISTPRPHRSVPSSASVPDLQRSPSLSKRSSLKLPKSIAVTHSSSSSEEPPSVPPLPSHVAASTQPPLFSPVLIAEPSLPSAAPNPEKVIITLETCTQTYRTTLSTLTTRSSHLSKYLFSLYPPPSPNSVATSSSLYSSQSDDGPAVYKQHLTTSQPVVPLTSTLHIFLDRPSAPYAYILSYLRQPLIDSQPESLPYALQLHNYTSSTVQASFPSILQSKLDTLIEVRDEAAYLNLEGLHRLCVEEIKNRYNSKQHLLQIMGQGQGHHMRGLSSSSIQSLHSLHASIYNLHPLQEKAETELDASPDIISNSTSSSNPPLNATSSPLPTSPGFRSVGLPAGPSPAAIATRRRSKQALASAAASSAENIMPVSRTPPTPQSFEGRPEHQHQLSQSVNHNRSRSSSRSRPTRPPTAGWI